MINKNLATLADTPRGEKILELFNIQSVKLIVPEQLQTMHKLFLDYQSLQEN